MLTRIFVRVAETSNTYRYGEQLAPDQPEAIGTLYIRKSIAAELGNPERIKVAFDDAAKHGGGGADG